jgi:hypothetical protein
MTMRNRKNVAAIAVALIVLDAAFSAAVAWMMWWNAGWNVADLSGLALTFTVLSGGTIVLFRQLLAPRPRYGLGDSRSIRSERIVIVAHIAIAIALIAVWRVTDVYLLGWFSTLTTIVLLVSNVILLLTDLAGKSIGREGRRLRAADQRRMGQIEWMHVAAAAAGFVGLFVTAPVHAWNPFILNVSVVLVAATMIAGSLAASAVRRRGDVPAAQP